MQLRGSHVFGVVDLREHLHLLSQYRVILGRWEYLHVVWLMPICGKVDHHRSEVHHAALFDLTFLARFCNVAG